jgi:sugar transferase (PEP-CTERM system associated)
MNRFVSRYLHRNGVGRALVDTAMIVAAVYGLLLVVGDGSELGKRPGSEGLTLAAGILFVNTASGFYGTRPNRTFAASLLSACISLAFALPLTYLILSFTAPGLGSLSPVHVAAMAGVAAVILHRGYEVARSAAKAGRRSRILIFGSGEPARVVGNTLRTSDGNAEIVGYLAGPNERASAVSAPDLLPQDRSLLQTVRDHDVDEVVVALTERRAGSMPLRELLDCKLAGVTVHDINSHFERRLGQIRIDYVYAGWLVFGDGFNQRLSRMAIKRAFDIVSAAVLLAISAPVMLLTALAIRLDSRGPILYKQERVGMNGKPFMCVKFRSMRTDSEVDGKPRWASTNDDRITRVGHLIRKTRIDELPQLFSVLKGDMSLVGPRPERPFFVEQLTQQIPFYAVRHSVKPGLTGWAQIRYQYGSTVEDSQEKLQYDLYYVKNHALWLDLQIVLETIGVVLTGKGAR